MDIITIIIGLIALSIIAAHIYYYFNILGVMRHQSWLWAIATFVLHLFFGISIIPIVIFYNRYELSDEQKRYFKPYFWIFPIFVFMFAFPAYLEDQRKSEALREFAETPIAPISEPVTPQPAMDTSVTPIEQPPPSSTPKRTTQAKRQPPPPDINEQIIQMAQEMQADLPIYINDAVSLTQVQAGNKKMTFTYSLNDMQRDDDIPQNQINAILKRETAGSDFCATLTIEESKLLKNGATFLFRFYDINDDFFGEVSVTKQDCP